jgi:hypothetical protein
MRTLILGLSEPHQAPGSNSRSSTNFLYFLVAIGRRLQPPSFLGYNLREDPTPQFFGYNQKEATTPYVLQLQLEGGYNHLSFPYPTTLKYK